MKNKKITFVLFGSTGDLAKKKIIPALNKIAETTNINLMCIGRRNFSEKEYKEFLKKDNVIISNKINLKYTIIDFKEEQTITKMHKEIKIFDKNSSDLRLFYMATSSKYFEEIARNISKEKDVPIRVLFEKPFGRDLKSFKKLNKELTKHLDEEEIYRVDHYLAKETIENILSLRLANPFFEKTWNSKFIQEIKLDVKENFGVKNRLEYYDETGATKDMLQNHMLQVAALILMDPPSNEEANEVKKQKIKAINSLEHVKSTLGQYESYKKELAVKGLPESNTETYLEAEFKSNNKRWKGTKIILRTGKQLDEKKAYIQLTYKKDPCTVYCDITTPPNKLTINIQPNQNVDLAMNMRINSEKNEYKHVKLDFCPTCGFKANTKESYQKIIEEAIKGNKEMFLCAKSLEASWKITDKMIQDNAKNKIIIYKDGSETINEPKK